MTVTIANAWENIWLATLGFAALLFLFFKGRFKHCWLKVKELGFVSALPSCFRQVRWILLSVPPFSLGIAIVLVVGLHRHFWAIEVSDAGLTLNYPWPRSDVHLKWEDLSEAKMETRQFGVWGRHMFRLTVRAGAADYWSPWSGRDEIERTGNAIKMHIETSQKR